MRHWPGQRFIAVLIILVALTLSGISCGLPTIPFLNAPQDPGFLGGPENRVLTFAHNPNNDGDDFKGYELYYKLYTDEQTQLIDNDTNFIEATPQQPGPSRLDTRGFVRAVAVRDLEASPDSYATLTSDRPPHIPTDPTGTSITYRLNVEDQPNADPEAYVYLSWTQGGERRRGFRRRSADDTFASDPTELKSFWNRSAYSADDWDIARMNLSDEIQSETQTPGRFRIVWYVLSYGIDGTDFNSYYSEPLRLSPAVLVLRNP